MRERSTLIRYKITHTEDAEACLWIKGALMDERSRWSPNGPSLFSGCEALAVSAGFRSCSRTPVRRLDVAPGRCPVVGRSARSQNDGREPAPSGGGGISDSAMGSVTRTRQIEFAGPGERDDESFARALLRVSSVCCPLDVKACSMPRQARRNPSRHRCSPAEHAHRSLRRSTSCRSSAGSPTPA